MFQGDEEVRSDKGLDPACYGRLRNICSSMVAIYNALSTSERMVPSPVSETVVEVIRVNGQKALQMPKATSLLRFLLAKSQNMPDDLFSKLMTAVETGGFEREDEASMTQWFNDNGLRRDFSSLQVSILVISGLEEEIAEREHYSDDSINTTYFQSAQGCIGLIDSIRNSPRPEAQTDLGIAPGSS